MQCAGQNVIVMLTIGRSEQLRCIGLLMGIRIVVPGESHNLGHKLRRIVCCDLVIS
jgi:hypothetical protein